MLNFTRVSNPGKILKTMTDNSFVQILGVTSPYHALMAEKCGAKALYVSGAGVANMMGFPDLGITTINDVASDVERIARVTSLPILVDIDTGFGSAFNIRRTIQDLETAGAAAVHIEDQSSGNKRCGHRPNKSLCSLDEMQDRISTCINSRTSKDFVIMARCDSYATEGLDGLITRQTGYIEAGADMLFSEAMSSIDQYKKITDASSVPVLANITEFGKTPLFTVNELSTAGIKMALYPLSAFRASNKAAETVFKTILSKGSAKDCLDTMQTSEELYQYLDYHSYESDLDKLVAKK